MAPLRSVIRSVLLGGALAAWLPVQSAAQITVDGTLGPPQALVGPDFVVGSDLGQIRGQNLFHSFGEFNVRTGESATFTGPATIQNVLSRVTGGNPSLVDGLLRSTISGASFYLLNPQGVMFGPNASLDVNGAFHASTADAIRFADGGVFFADPGAPTLLSVADPVSFGFLSGAPAAITVDRSVLQVPAGQTLSLVGGDAYISGGVLSAPSGRVQIASVGSAGDVTPTGAGIGADLRLDGFDALGTVTIDRSTLSASGPVTAVDPGGAIVIRGGRLVTLDSELNAAGNPGGLLRVGVEALDLWATFVSTGTFGAADHPGTAVDIEVAGLATLRGGSEIASSSFGAGRAGDVRIQAGSIVLGDDDPASSPFSDTGFYGDIGSRAFDAGRGGDLEIVAGSLTIKNGFFINTAALSLGDAGNISVRANELTILDGASISSNGFWLGRGGVVDIEVGQMLISALGINGVPNCPCLTGVAAQTGFGSPGGAIVIRADTLQLLDGGQVSTALFSSGPGADIEITARELVISGVVLQATPDPLDVHAGIDARVVGDFASGNGGDIRVVADSVEIADGGFITSSLFDGAPGTAGQITIDAGTITIRDRGSITAGSLFGSGSAGAIVVNAGSLVITGVADSPSPFAEDFTGLSTATGPASRTGGDIQVTAADLEVADKGGIVSATFGAADGGNIRIEAGQFVVTTGGAVTASTLGAGDGGNIEVWADAVTVAGTGTFLGPTDAGVSAIASQAGTGGGDAGDVRITAGRVAVLDSGRITTETFGSGAGGDLDISAGTVIVSGVDPGLREALGPGVDRTVSSASISASSNRFFLADAATGSAGTVRIEAGEVHVSSEGVISSTTDTPGSGGTLTIVADRVILSEGGQLLTSSRAAATGPAGDITVQASQILSITGTADGAASGLFSTTGGSGDAGQIRVIAPVISVQQGGQLSVATDGPGNGGAVTVEGGVVTLGTDSGIFSDAGSSGRGGNIHVEGDEIRLVGGTLSARSTGAGDAGNITLRAGTVFSSEGGVVTTGALQADGGDIDILADFMVHLVTSEVTTSVQGGEGRGGNISIDPQFVILDRSRIRADAFGGPGGNVTIAADVFLSSDSVLSASSALGVPGTIDVQARITDVSGGLANLPESVLQAASLLRASCAARTARPVASSLVFAPLEGFPPEPGGLLPSGIVHDAPIAARIYDGSGRAPDDRYGTVWMLRRPRCEK